MSGSRLVTAPNNMPVGSVLPWAGDASQTANVLLLYSEGWVNCNGSLYAVSDYPDLYAAIGTCHGGKSTDGVITNFNVPNLNGVYVRGVDPQGERDPDNLNRIEAAPNGCAGNEVGSIQSYATTAPHNPFVTDSQGAHTHTVSPVTLTYEHTLNGGAHDMAHVNKGSTKTAKGGSHSHDITGGGDPETRPASLCMSWIIRFSANTGEQVV